MRLALRLRTAHQPSPAARPAGNLRRALKARPKTVPKAARPALRLPAEAKRLAIIISGLTKKVQLNQLPLSPVATLILVLPLLRAPTKRAAVIRVVAAKAPLSPLLLRKAELVTNN